MPDGYRADRGRQRLDRRLGRGGRRARREGGARAAARVRRGRARRAARGRRPTSCCFMDADGSLDPAPVAARRRAGARPAGRPGAGPAPPDRAAGPGRCTPGWATRLLAWRLRRAVGVPRARPRPDARGAAATQLLGAGPADRRFGYPLEMVLRAGPGRAGGWPRSTSTTRPRAGGRSKVTGTRARHRPRGPRHGPGAGPVNAASAGDREGAGAGPGQDPALPTVYARSRPR